MQYDLGIDIGTSSVKVLAVDRSGRTVALEKGDYPILTPRPGFREQEPDDIVRECLAAVGRVVRQLGQPPQVVGVSGAMHSLIAVDDRGRPLTRAILWADTRSRDLAEALRASAEGRKIYEATGTPIHALSPLLKIRWLRLHEPEVFRRAALFADIKSYFLYRLTGRWYMDYSMAAATGLFNMRDLDWNAASLAYAGVGPAQLPQLVDTSFRLPGLDAQVAAGLGIPENASWIIGASDGCLANLGSFAFDRRTLTLSAGTSAALRFTAPSPVVQFEGQPFCYYLDADRYVVGGASNNGGFVWNWFVETHCPDLTMEEALEAAAAVAPGAGGLLFLPWLLGERAPIWDSRASGVFLGVQERHGRAHFARAVLEGIALNLRRIYQDVQAGAELAAERIVSSGGLARADLWNQILADMFEHEVLTIQETEAPALGAVLLAQKATGRINDYGDRSNWRQTGRTYRPREESVSTYRRLQAAAFPLYDRLKPVFSALSEV